jgi:tetrahydromethanopterin S-methyltransferase subunit B
MSRYKSTKLSNLGPVHGFLIHTPDDRKLKDTHPQTIVRELNRMADRIKRLEEAGDDLYANFDPSRWDSTATAARKLSDQNAWLKAKDAK